MLGTLIADLESALAGTRLPRGRSRASFAAASNDAASFSEWLPYRAYLEDSRVFVNRDALAFCLELRPQSGGDEEMARILTSLFSSAPAGTAIQFHLLASPDIRRQLAAYARLRVSDPEIPEFAALGRAGRHGNLYRTLARRRVGHYLAGARRSLLPTQSYLLRDFRLVVSVSLAGDPGDLARLEDLLLLRDGLRATLHAAGFPSRTWHASDLINWVSALIDPHRLNGDSLPLAYDEGRELRSQVIDRGTGMLVRESGIRLSNAADESCANDLRLLSVRSFPPRFALWNMGTLIGDLYQGSLQVPCPFLLSLGVHVLDPEATRNWAYLKAARATTNATSYMARFLPDLQERKADWDIVLKALDDGQQLVDLQHTVALLAPSDEITRAEQAARALFRARGFELTSDSMMMTQALIGSLPMTWSPPFHADLKRMKRVSTKTSANAVHLSPLIAEWQGTGTPVLVFGGRRGQLMQIDIYDNSAGNHNVAIAGTSGSGKSLLLNEIAASYLGAGAKVWIIDVGRSYEKTCRYLGGSFIEFTESAALSLNPFALAEDIDEDMELLQPLLAQMASPREALSAFQYATLGTAIKKVWSEKGSAMTVSDLHDLLASGRIGEGGDQDQRLRDLAAMLQPYTRQGVYGKYFEGGSPIDFRPDFTVLELEELKAKKDLQTVVLLIVMYRITREMYFSRERKKIVIIDEAWDLLSGGATAEFIEAGYRRARKYKGAFMSATQGVDDYYRNPAAKAALDNSDWMFLLRQKPESIEMMDKLGQLTMDDAMKRLLQSLRTEHGAYSEIFIHSPAGSGVGRLLVDPYSLLLFSSRAEDFTAVNEKRAAGLSVSQAIDEVLRDRAR